MYNYFFKRIIDISVSLISLIVFSPIFLLISLILYFSKSNGGIIFYQNRPGKNEKVFKLIKFKTMNDTRDGDGKLLPDSQRISKIGKTLRKTSLDELPQLINVLKGEMSLIGPRPLAVQYLPYYNKIERTRHNARPGITGLAQVMGRKSLTWEERFEYDVKYVQSISFKLDVKILLLTFVKVIKRENVEGSANIDFDKYRMNYINQI
jgi:lipopolysaccharide/colanic/teichoic acid biosynthesis glycosyltransferase